MFWNIDGAEVGFLSKDSVYLNILLVEWTHLEKFSSRLVENVTELQIVGQSLWGPAGKIWLCCTSVSRFRFIYLVFFLEQCILLASSPNFTLDIISNVLQTGALLSESWMRVLCLCFVLSYKCVLLGTHFKMLVKPASLFTCMRSGAVGVGPPLEQRGLCRPLAAAARCRRREVPSSSALRTHCFLRWRTRRHTQAHPCDFRGKKHISHEARGAESKKVRPE